jgi:hypothetical protein
VPKRRAASRPFYARVAGAGVALLLELCATAVHRPVDFAATLVAALVSLVIVVNAVFWQSGVHPAPFLAPPAVSGTAQITGTAMSKLAESGVAARSAGVAAPPGGAQRDDPIADLIGPSPRIAAVQRALSEYGYGQIKPSGILDSATSDAIERFEREHKMPVTGRVTGRLLNDLTTLVGHPLN